jgi:hypothetical protein
MLVGKGGCLVAWSAGQQWPVGALPVRGVAPQLPIFLAEEKA